MFCSQWWLCVYGFYRPLILWFNCEHHFIRIVLKQVLNIYLYFCVSTWRLDKFLHLQAEILKFHIGSSTYNTNNVSDNVIMCIFTSRVASGFRLFELYVLLCAKFNNGTSWAVIELLTFGLLNFRVILKVFYSLCPSRGLSDMLFRNIIFV